MFHRPLILLKIVELILFIVDSGCTKHMTGNLTLLCNFVEKYMGAVRFGNDQFAPIIGYGDLVQGYITINRVYYVEGLNHNLFSVGQFCDADLEVAFRKSTCFVRDLQGNDLLTGNRGSDLYTISLQETTSSTPLCLMAKASPTQAWLWHRRLSHLNFDYINLLSKKDVVIGLPKLKYVKDQLCSSCEVSKAKRSSFKTKAVPSSKGRLNLLHMDLCGPMRVASINGKKYILPICHRLPRRQYCLGLGSPYWCRYGPFIMDLGRSFPRLYALELKKGITVADKLIDASFVASFCRNPRGGVEEEQLHHLVELVGSISLSPSNDRWEWLLGSSGEFSVHSARTFIDDILLPFVGDVTRWVKVVPIKVNILAWKVCLDKLPTRLNLSLRGIDIPSIICPNCGLAGESCSHLFYSCNLARTLWRKIARWWEIDIPDFSCYEEWIAWFKTTRFSKAQKEMLEGVFYVMWWMIWKFRNQVLFGSSHPRMELLFDDIVSYSFTWCSNRCKNNIDWISWMKCPKSISL
ncbi:retrovirus-related pol polyprotein from transposon TNT 1-94 [Tanacetum coccineum]